MLVLALQFSMSDPTRELWLFGSVGAADANGVMPRGNTPSKRKRKLRRLKLLIEEVNLRLAKQQRPTRQCTN